MNIQRWDLQPNGQPLWSEDDGDYVLHSDHVAELEKLRESVRRLVDSLNGWWSLDPEAPPHEWVRAERIAREARDALVKEHAFLAENKELTPPQTEGRESNQ